MGRARVVLRGWEIEDEVAIEKVIRFTTVYKACCRRTASHICREVNLLVQQTGFSAGQPTRSMHWAACGFGSLEVCAVYTVVELLGDLPPFPPPRPVHLRAAQLSRGVLQILHLPKMFLCTFCLFLSIPTPFKLQWMGGDSTGPHQPDP